MPRGAFDDLDPRPLRPRAPQPRASRPAGAGASAPADAAGNPGSPQGLARQSGCDLDALAFRAPHRPWAECPRPRCRRQRSRRHPPYPRREQRQLRQGWAYSGACWAVVSGPAYCWRKVPSGRRSAGLWRLCSLLDTSRASSGRWSRSPTRWRSAGRGCATAAGSTSHPKWPASPCACWVGRSSRRR